MLKWNQLKSYNCNYLINGIQYIFAKWKRGETTEWEKIKGNIKEMNEEGKEQEN